MTRRSVIGPALVVAGVYGVLLFGLFGLARHDPRDFIYLGSRYITRSQASPVIRVDPGYHGYLRGPGYDGQFYYFIALDPVNARFYIDDPSYRYGRILYPMLARVLSLGQPALIPWALIAINWIAVTGGTLALAARLKAVGVSTWFALLFGLLPGMYVSFRRDLADVLAYALVAVALYLFYRGGRARAASAVVFALAALTRETTAVFAVAVALALAFPTLRNEAKQTFSLRRGRGRVRVWASVAFLAVALGPTLLYRGALALLVGGKAVGDPFEPFPFLGVAANWPWGRTLIAEVVTIVLPSLIAAGLALVALYRRRASAEAIALLVNVIAFVVFLNRYSYGDFAASSRVAIPVALATVAALSLLDRARISRAWFYAAGVLWLLPLPFTILPPLGRLVGID